MAAMNKLILLMLILAVTTGLDIALPPVQDTYIQRDAFTSFGGEKSLVLSGEFNYHHHTSILIQFNTTVLESKALDYFDSGSNLDTKYSNVNESVLDSSFIHGYRVTSAEIKLKCVEVSLDSDSLQIVYSDSRPPFDRNDRAYQSSNVTNHMRVFTSVIVKPWDERSVTWRRQNGFANWNKPYLDTSGVDAKYATSPPHEIHFNTQSDSTDPQCQDLSLDVTDAVNAWIHSNHHSNLGLLLWSDSYRHRDEVDIARGAVVVKYASWENVDESLRPQLLVTVTERKPGDCAWNPPLRCAVGQAEQCVPQSKVCDFTTNCEDGEDQQDCD